ncbi:VOC family protein [Hyphomicrobium sp. CS1GBMeth3]|uniref:VOC family protein n=1 Tax=Hyphomicrobium sp. CS1GBMeth3 TaxID=1892845 RepID=UPI0009309252|nr:VOC family protein [Hyphomicrobium sp. CS1GBMeth3]
MRFANVATLLTYARAPAIAAVAALAAHATPALAEGCTTPAGTNVGTVWWSELLSTNPERTRAFYAGVAGWTPKVVSAEDTSRTPNEGEAEYTMFTNGVTEVAGSTPLETSDTRDTRPQWMTYIQVTDVDHAVFEALKNGGRILKAPFEQTSVGRMAIVADPDGIPVGLVTPTSRAPAH